MPQRGDLRAILAHGRALRTLLLWSSFFLGLLTLYLLLNWLPTLMVGQGSTDRRPPAHRSASIWAAQSRRC